MVNINYTLVKELRERTGAGIVICKEALIKTQGNIELAIDYMYKLGKIKASRKEKRITDNGIIFIKIANNHKRGSILELNCETDFVEKNHEFKNFGNEIISHAINTNLIDLNSLKEKFERQRINLITKLGENINIRRIQSLENEVVGYYLHGIRIGVIVSFSGKINKEIIKHIAMHIAASRPTFVRVDNIPKSLISREKNIQFEIAKNSKKSQEILEKIVEGRMYKFINNISLIEQNFIMDNNKTVGQILKENSLEVHNFVRFEVGEGIDSTLDSLYNDNKKS